MSAVELVIFDCDGVLVDSEPISVEVLLEIVAEEGVQLDPQVGYQRFLGRSLASICEILRSEYHLALTDDALTRMRQRLHERFRLELQATPRVGDALKTLNRPYCVASSSQIERINLSLEVTGLAGCFAGHVFSASMVKAGKPAPDLFLYAAAQMGVSPKGCLVVEDSPAGFIAARRAGMRVASYIGGAHAGPSDLKNQAEQFGPEAIFNDFAQLRQVLLDLESADGASSG